MRKYIPLFLIAGLLSCDDSDNIFLNKITVTEVFADYPAIPNEQGKYVNYFGAHVKNSSPKPIKGYVRFTLREYGSVNSYQHTVKPNNESQAYFEASLETDKVINESYLLEVEFVNVKN